MEMTPRFTTTLKYLGLFTIIIILYSFALSYFSMSGISISHPEENTDMRLWLNKLKGIMLTSAFWLAVGHVTKDYKAAIGGLMTSLLIQFGTQHFYSRQPYGSTPTVTRLLVDVIVDMLPYLTFGAIHFRNSLAFKLLAVWAFSWGLGVAYDPHVFERMVEGLTRIVGIRDPFEIRVSTGETSYRPISVLRLITNGVITLSNFVVFWALYSIIKSGKSLWTGLHTCEQDNESNRLTHSIVYWSLRLVLFVTALGIASFIGNSFRQPLNAYVIVRVAAYGYAIIVLSATYRNFLVSYFASRGSYPGGLYFWLNIPLVNIIAWIYNMVTFQRPIASDQMSNSIATTTSNFKAEGRNNGWKIVIILMTIISSLYQLNRAGLRIDGPSRDGVFWVLTTLFITFALLVWYLYDKNAYAVLIAIFIGNLVVVSVVRSEAMLQPSISTGLVNAVLFYGLFYFDELKWNLPKIAKPTSADEQE